MAYYEKRDMLDLKINVHWILKLADVTDFACNDDKSYYLCQTPQASK